jgi:tRNA(Ile)-lysidine synthetase-like protein
MDSLSQIAKEETEIIKEYINKIIENISQENKFNTKEFFNQSDSIQKRILYEIISPLFPQDYDRERILTLWEFLKENKKSKSGKKISLTTDKWIFINEKYIEIISKQEITKTDIHITKEGEYKNGGITVNISKCDTNLDESFRGNGRTVFVDLRGLDFDFHLRTRQDGDIIQPLGMNGTQKLKKYLNSRKIPNHKKDNLLFLTQGKEILWAIDIGLSDKIKIKTKPTHKITITIKD